MVTNDDMPKFLRYAQQYDQNLHDYEQLASIVDEKLKTATKSAGIKTHSIANRVKERKSFLEKIQRKSYINPLQDMGDIVAARVVTLFKEDLEAVDRAIRKCFTVVDRDDKEKNTESNKFGYTSIHYDCYLKDAFADDYNPRLADIRFEIQTRTVLTDAWASIEHYLAYKGSASIPSQIKRDLSALSAVFYLADKQFHDIVTEVHAIEARVAEDNPDRLDEVSLNRDTVRALLRRTLKDRDESSRRDYSELVEQLNACGYENLKQVSDKLDAGLGKAQAYEALTPPFDPMTLEETRFNDVGLAMLAISSVDERMNELHLDNVIDDVDEFLMDTYGGF